MRNGWKDSGARRSVVIDQSTVYIDKSGCCEIPYSVRVIDSDAFCGFRTEIIVKGGYSDIAVTK